MHKSEERNEAVCILVHLRSFTSSSTLLVVQPCNQDYMTVALLEDSGRTNNTATLKHIDHYVVRCELDDRGRQRPRTSITDRSQEKPPRAIRVLSEGDRYSRRKHGQKETQAQKYAYQLVMNSTFSNCDEIGRSQTIQADDDPATEKDQVDTRPGNLTNKKPKSTGGHDQVKELTAWYQVSHAHKLNDLNEAFKWNHQCLLNDLGEPGLGHREPSQGYDIVHAADIDHYLDCTARQRTLWNKMRMVKDVMFKVGLKQEIRGWSSADVFGYRDKLDLAYLRVLRKLQVEGAANLKRAQAKMGTRDDSQAVQKKRDTVNEEIRRLENGLSDE